MKKKTVVIGATSNPDRYSFIAINRLLQHGHEVVRVGIKKGSVAGHEILIGQPYIPDVHTITLYIRPSVQEQLYEYILSLKPKRIIFNPGTENEIFEKMARSRNIETVEGCTLVMLSIGVF